MTVAISTVRELHDKIRQRNQYIAGLREALTTTTQILDGMPKAKNYSSRLEALTAEILDAEKEREELQAQVIDAGLSLATEIFQRITNDIGAKILFMRYVQCLQFSEIALRLHYSEQWIYFMHSRYLKQFSDSTATPAT